MKKKGILSFAVFITLSVMLLSSCLILLPTQKKDNGYHMGHYKKAPAPSYRKAPVPAPSYKKKVYKQATPYKHKGNVKPKGNKHR